MGFLMAASSLQSIIKTKYMFTIEQIKAAHAKVKSGADFPAYVQALVGLGVSSYTTYVSDGHTLFNGADSHSAQAGPRYEVLEVAAQSDPAKFIQELKAHQQGKSSYAEFCSSAAATGVNKWITDMGAMTCTYYDKAGAEIYTEAIPH
jgi:uncharacterized protein YbcV (DUF1398 family)